MANIICETPEITDKAQALLEKSIPNHRHAYSDRTAWLMACLSELAYIRFNPLFESDTKAKLVAKLVALVDLGKHELLNKFIDQMVYDHDAEKARLIDELSSLKMELIATFDNKATEAILVEHPNFIALAFRGTEINQVQDLITDGNIATTPSDVGGKVHTGFSKAYEAVGSQIQAVLDNEKYANKPLFITGHSLGGALATLATRRLVHQGGIAACYTFGSPRVGNTAWVSEMRNAVYRVVNAADFVTVTPPSGLMISSLSGILQFVPKFGDTLKRRINDFGGYMHCGNMRYLTNCKKGTYEDVQLLYSVDIPYRIKGFLARKMRRWSKPLTDHSISIYRKKLFLIALRRNNL